MTIGASRDGAAAVVGAQHQAIVGHDTLVVDQANAVRVVHDGARGEPRAVIGERRAAVRDKHR